VLLIGFAPHFAWDIPLGERPVLAFTAAFALTGLLFAGFIAVLSRETPQGHPTPARSVVFILAVGLVARLALIPSVPILEDDFYRYQWDGAVVANGGNPYRHPPARFVTSPLAERLLAQAGLRPTPPPPGHETLARDGHDILLRINNPHIATIYPPLAQIGFALGHWLTPWRLTGWKIVVLIAELATAGFLLGALASLKRPPQWLAIYWWHPLALKELANSAHMDALLLPFLAAALWMLAAGRTRRMAAALAGAAAVKLWPLLVAPLMLRRDRRAIATGIAIVAAALFLVAPQVAVATDDSGLARYSADWQRNALAFPAAVALLQGWVADPGAAVRLAVAALLTGYVAHVWLRIPAEPLARIHATGTAILLLLLLGPTGYPWYALWLVPVATVQPRASLIALMACAPAYYLDFWVQLRPDPAAWFWLAPALSAGPAWLLLAHEARARTRAGA
jgi:hypothetical protein